MKPDRLAAPLADWVYRLKAASSTIEAEMQDVLAESRSQREFVERAEEAIWSLIGECNDWLNHLKRAASVAREPLSGNGVGNQSEIHRRDKS